MKKISGELKEVSEVDALKRGRDGTVYDETYGVENEKRGVFQNFNYGETESIKNLKKVDIDTE